MPRLRDSVVFAIKYDKSIAPTRGGDGLYHFTLINGEKEKYGFAYARPFHCGYAVVKQKPFGLHRYMDGSGYIRENGYPMANDYENNQAIVADRFILHGYRLLNLDGVESKPYFNIEQTKYPGYHIVENFETHTFQFINMNGDLSKKIFKNRFICKKFNPTNLEYLSSESKEKPSILPKENKYKKSDKENAGEVATKKHNSIEDYLGGFITVYGLKQEDILDNLEAIQKQEEYYYLQGLALCETKEQMEALYTEEMQITEYIKQVAYEAFAQKQAKEAESKKVVEAKTQHEEKILF